MRKTNLKRPIGEVQAKYEDDIRCGIALNETDTSSRLGTPYSEALLLTVLCARRFAGRQATPPTSISASPPLLDYGHSAS
jgi:hypothetical protein